MNLYYDHHNNFIAYIFYLLHRKKLQKKKKPINGWIRKQLKLRNHLNHSKMFQSNYCRTKEDGRERVSKSVAGKCEAGQHSARIRNWKNQDRNGKN